MEEIDIWRTAKILIEAHGEDASSHAALRADHALKDGNLDAVAVWKRVTRAIEELTKPTTGIRH